MTAPILSSEARRNVALFSPVGLGFEPKYTFAKKPAKDDAPEQDVLVVSDIAVFRSGHFYDSLGFEHNWEDIQMDQMVANYNLLKQRGIFTDVPVRKGHPGFLDNRMDTLIGYHTELKAEVRKSPSDGVQYTYLIATFEILDPAAITKINSKLWRHVSAETGGWQSNNATEFWPVLHGVAFVDIPAVEGLSGFNSYNGVGTRFSIMSTTKEIPVTSPTNGSVANAAANNGTATPTTPPATPSPAVSFQTADPTAFARSQFTFTINGGQTQDFSAVQAHITALETASAEQREQSRKDFIRGLAEGATPKIMATQIPNIESYALKMDDTSWGSFKDSWGAAQPVPAVSMHSAGATTNPTGNTPATGATEPSETDTLAAVVKQHRYSGMRPEEIAKTGSFQKLQKIDPNHPALSA